ncbi:hypothetical protein [Pseudohaliea sp.]|uniref:hypothetical protein n=1 Tax=Pseudohaliea sp. TaxID=2740289 RepID=UPI0032F00B37
MLTLRQLLAPVLAAGFLCSAGAQAAPMVFTVDALTDTRVSPLNTGIALLAGDAFEVSVDPDDLWNAGALPRWSNADGLVGDLFATGSDESGEAAGTRIGRDFGPYSNGGFTAPYGALVGQLDSAFFFIGTSFAGTAPVDGTLSLLYWDSNYADNTDAIDVTVSAGQVPIPAPAALIGVGLLALGWRRRRAS